MWQYVGNTILWQNLYHGFFFFGIHFHPYHH
jgi:hypothetical protein